MTITRSHICDLVLAKAEVDDFGAVKIAVAGYPLTPDEAREFAAEITAAAAAGDAYLAEQAES